jgi:hypothetical protein
MKKKLTFAEEIELIENEIFTDTEWDDLDSLEPTGRKVNKRIASDTEIERMMDDFHDFEAQFREDLDYEIGW